jgi:Zn-dependent protease
LQSPAGDASAARCSSCNTELAPTALSCPACGTLVHSAALKQIVAEADAAKASGDLQAANGAWQRALDLLPYGSQQHNAITARLAESTRQLAGSSSPIVAKDPDAPWYKRYAAGIGAFVILALTKGKFLLLGLTKAKTLLSMFAFFGVYWTLYGWPFALGLVMTIYVHEMGHVFVLTRLGIESSAPMFIPGLGAFIVSKRRFDDPSIDARVGLGGPVWGLGAGVVAWLAYRATGIEVLGAIAAVTGFINLFNLIPVWQLDGSHAFRALARWQRWVVVGVVAATYYVARQPMLLFVGAGAVFRGFQKTDVEGDRTALVTFIGLVLALAWLSGTHATARG